MYLRVLIACQPPTNSRTWTGMGLPTSTPPFLTPAVSLPWRQHLVSDCAESQNPAAVRCTAWRGRGGGEQQSWGPAYHPSCIPSLSAPALCSSECTGGQVPL